MAQAAELDQDLVAEANLRQFREATPAMTDPTLPLPGLSPVSGKAVVAKFDGGLLSSDGGVLALREVDLVDLLAEILGIPLPIRGTDVLSHVGPTQR